jgi:uncharacterized protein (DUF1330 family)
MKMSDAYLFVSYKQAPIRAASRLRRIGDAGHPAIWRYGDRQGRAEPHLRGGQSELTVLVRFNSVDEAAALYDSATYREALAALGSGAGRHVRIIPALQGVIT